VPELAAQYFFSTPKHLCDKCFRACADMEVNEIRGYTLTITPQSSTLSLIHYRYSANCLLMSPTDGSGVGEHARTQ
jgi:hypothetical protein